MEREIIQIAISNHSVFSSDGDGLVAIKQLYALCNDGTIWRQSDLESLRWQRVNMEPIPQCASESEKGKW